MRGPNDPTALGGCLQRLHPAAKVLCCLTLIGAALAVPAPALARLAWPAAALLLLWVAAGLPLRRLLARLGVALPFVLLAGASLPFFRHAESPTVAQWGSLAVTEAGLLAFAAVIAKALVCLLALSLLGEVTPPHHLLSALRQLRVPALLVTVLSLTVRYLAVLPEEGQRMTHARDARGTPPSLGRRARVAGAMIGTLFLRGFERAERVGYAMAARGFTGTLPVVTQGRWRPTDTLALAAVVAGAALMVVV